MQSKYRMPVSVFLASFILIIGGIVLKTMRWPQTSAAVFGGGMLVQMGSIVWLIAVIIKPGKKS